jgi:tetratricopeptide (TPR) repeat protein
MHINLIPVLRAEAAYAENRYDEAIVFYEEAIRINPQNPILYLNKALVMAQADRLTEALAAVNKGLEMDPGNERAMQVKNAVEASIENAARIQANSLIAEGNKLLDSDAAAALKRFEEANALTGETMPMVWQNVGRARAKLRQETEAIAAFRRAIELAPAEQRESYQMYLAQFYLDAKRPDEALDVVVAGASNPEQLLFDIYNRTKNNPDSIPFSTAALERVLKLNPSNFDAVFELGQVYYMDRRDGESRELLTRYIEHGTDEQKIQTARDFLVILNSRNKPKPELID